MDFFNDIGMHILLAGVAIIVVILLSVFSKKTSIPAPTVFITAGLVLSYFFPDIGNTINAKLIVEVGSWVLVIIIFEAGFTSGFSKFTSSFKEVVLLGTIGTLLTAALLGLAAYFIVGLPLELAVLIAVALAPTDPAAVFSVLSGQRLIGRSGKILEGEAGANDPISIALMIGAIEWALHSGDISATHIIQDLFAEMCVGIICGLTLGYLANWFLTNIHLKKRDLLLLAMLGTAFLIYGLTVFVGGSGFLAVFVAALIIGEVPIINNDRSQDLISALAGISELTIFTMLGLSIVLSSVAPVWVEAVVLFILLTLIRFVVVHLLMQKSSSTNNERNFIAWGGLKGAVPIILAAAVVASGVPDASKVETIVFWTVFISIAVQGGTLKYLAKKIGLVAKDDKVDPEDLITIED